MKRPGVTVLMPVYNGSRFLSEAIESILRQSLREFDFLIIDDGSTDDSESIVRSYDDPRILFFKNEKNLGISATLNKGIQLAKTDLIARMDSDDISHPHRLQMQLDYMRRNPDCAMVSTWANVVTEDKKFVRLERYPSEFYYYNLAFECWIYHPTIMFRKKPIEEVDMYSMPYSEDFNLFWKVSRKFKIGNIAEPLVDYRLSSTSLNLVQRKVEYNVSNEINVRRHLEFYLGNDIRMSKSVFECLRHNFVPISQQESMDEIKECLNVLNAITQKMLEDRQNPNWNEEAIRRAHFFKRRFILTEVSKHVSRQRILGLMLRRGEWSSIGSLIANALSWRLKRVRRAFSF